MHGQGNDGASNMSSDVEGVHAGTHEGGGSFSYLHTL